MTETTGPLIPDSGETFSDEEFVTVTGRVEAARAEAMKDPEFASMVESKTSSLGQRVVGRTATAHGLRSVVLAQS